MYPNSSWVTSRVEFEYFSTQLDMLVKVNRARARAHTWFADAVFKIYAEHKLKVVKIKSVLEFEIWNLSRASNLELCNRVELEYACPVSHYCLCSGLPWWLFNIINTVWPSTGRTRTQKHDITFNYTTKTSRKAYQVPDDTLDIFLFPKQRNVK